MSLNIRDVFDPTRDPLRDLNTIIQVQDTSQESLRVEFEEFVLTNALLKFLGEFLSDFSSNPLFDSPKKPVWLEGFYGSGKSHFAKIIGLLLMNKEIPTSQGENISTSQFFIDYILKDMMFETKEKKLAKVRDEAVTLLENLPNQFNTKTFFVFLAKYTKSESPIPSYLESFCYAIMSEFNAYLGLSSVLETAEIERAMMRDGIYEDFKQEVMSQKEK